MKGWVSKIVTYDQMPTDMMHVHVFFADEKERYHRTCEVMVFIEKDEELTMSELRRVAVDKAREFLREAAAAEFVVPGTVEEERVVM